MEIPLDGTISYFPLADNSMIVTKQLMPDGTSRTLVYKPYVENLGTETSKTTYVTLEKFNDFISEYESNNYDEEISKLKKQMEELKKNVKEGKTK